MFDFVAITNNIKPISFVGAAAVCAVAVFAMYTQDSDDFAYTRTCLAEQRAAGESNADATQTCNCLQSKHTRWTAENPDRGVPSDVDAQFRDECSGDYYIRRQQAREAAGDKPYKLERTGGWGEDADNVTQSDEGSDWGR